MNGPTSFTLFINHTLFISIYVIIDLISKKEYAIKIIDLKNILHIFVTANYR